MDSLKHTPLIALHRAQGARLVDFAGWEMPVQYSGVVDECRAVRQHAGLFDVSHMGRIRVSGSGSSAFLQRVTTNDVSKVALRASHYSMICHADGGIKDDVFLYHVQQDEFLLCVNASNRRKIGAWLHEQMSRTASYRVEDVSTELAQLALQGPASRDILIRLGFTESASLKPRRCCQTTFLNEQILVTRTGYTGELGYELYMPASIAADLWTRLFDVDRDQGLKPIGLGARDLLRLEMGYLLYGNDINEETTPIEAGAQWVVSFDKGDFIGRPNLWRQHTTGVVRRLVGFEMVEKAVPRQGFQIFAASEPRHRIGVVTSGNFSPLLQKGIGLGYVPPSSAEPGTKIAVDIRGKSFPAVVVKPPFYRKSNT